MPSRLGCAWVTTVLTVKFRTTWLIAHGALGGVVCEDEPPVPSRGVRFPGVHRPVVSSGSPVSHCSQRFALLAG